ncbi:MAG: thioredoxin domain-containing protein [Propionibacteriaceae bacterium]|nr:thioredoxin domain-containing protein [Propionibacteriaceae bacterium]
MTVQPPTATPGPDAAGQARRTTIVAVVTALAAIGLIVVFALWPRLSGQSNGQADLSNDPTASATQDPTETAPAVPAQPAVAPPHANADYSGVLATPDAPPQAPLLIIYQDYQCPWCKIFDQVFTPVISEAVAAGRLRLEIHTMTFLDGNLGNDASTRAAVAAACSDFFGVYYPFYEAIYANQPATEGDGYSDDLLRSTIPGQLGLSGEALASFQQCYDSRATLEFVQTVYQRAIEAGVRGTPSYVLDGQTLDLDPNDPNTLRTAIDQANG